MYLSPRSFFVFSLAQIPRPCTRTHSNARARADHSRKLTNANRTKTARVPKYTVYARWPPEDSGGIFQRKSCQCMSMTHFPNQPYVMPSLETRPRSAESFFAAEWMEYDVIAGKCHQPFKTGRENILLNFSSSMIGPSATICLGSRNARNTRRNPVKRLS